jgi:hypothetical protein
LLLKEGTTLQLRTCLLEDEYGLGRIYQKEHNSLNGRLEVTYFGKNASRNKNKGAECFYKPALIYGNETWIIKKKVKRIYFFIYTLFNYSSSK